QGDLRTPDGDAGLQPTPPCGAPGEAGEGSGVDGEVDALGEFPDLPVAPLNPGVAGFRAFREFSHSFCHAGILTAAMWIHKWGGWFGRARPGSTAHNRPCSSLPYQGQPGLPQRPVPSLPVPQGQFLSLLRLSTPLDLGGGQGQFFRWGRAYAWA